MPVTGFEKVNSKRIASKKRKAGGGVFWNFLTTMTVFGIILAAAWFALVFQNPYIFLNPFPPPVIPELLVLPSPTATIPHLPPTWTPEVTGTPIPTFTPEPESTIDPGQTEIASQGPTATKTDSPISLYSFDLQSPPTGINASVLYPERDCKWMGVGGQVLDEKGRPVTGITVQIGGYVDKTVVDQTSLTGLALKYGEAGYEFEISKQPIATSQTLWVRLIDQARLPLSPKIYFDTSDDCQRNLIVINFRQVR